MRWWNLDTGDCCEDQPIKVQDFGTGELINLEVINYQGGGGSSRVFKAGVIPSGSFSGTPRKATVAFTTPFGNALYAITLAGFDARFFTYEQKSASGFVISANADEALTGEVSWMATSPGETT